MEDAETRRRRRATSWTTTVLSSDVLEQMQAQDVRDHRALNVEQRVALCWTLSHEQFSLLGVVDDEPGLPRSHFGVHQR